MTPPASQIPASRQAPVSATPPVDCSSKGGIECSSSPIILDVLVLVIGSKAVVVGTGVTVGSNIAHIGRFGPVDAGPVAHGKVVAVALARVTLERRGRQLGPSKDAVEALVAPPELGVASAAAVVVTDPLLVDLSKPGLQGPLAVLEGGGLVGGWKCCDHAGGDQGEEGKLPLLCEVSGRRLGAGLWDVESIPFSNCEGAVVAGKVFGGC